MLGRKIKIRGLGSQITISCTPRTSLIHRYSPVNQFFSRSKGSPLADGMTQHSTKYTACQWNTIFFHQCSRAVLSSSHSCVRFIKIPHHNYIEYHEFPQPTHPYPLYDILDVSFVIISRIDDKPRITSFIPSARKPPKILPRHNPTNDNPAERSTSVLGKIAARLPRKPTPRSRVTGARRAGLRENGPSVTRRLALYPHRG